MIPRLTEFEYGLGNMSYEQMIEFEMDIYMFDHEETTHG